MSLYDLTGVLYVSGPSGRIFLLCICYNLSMNPEVKNNNPNKSNETGWEQLEGLKQNPELTANEASAVEESPEELSENHEQTLASQRELIDQTYEKPKEAYRPMEYDKDENAIIPKERSKGDFFGKMRDKSKIKKLQSIYSKYFDESLEAGKPVDPQKAFKKISPLLNEYTAQEAMLFCLDNIHEESAPLASLILEKIDQETIGKAIDPYSQPYYPNYLIENGVSEKIRKTVYISVRDSIINNQPKPDYNTDTSFLSESERLDLIHACFQRNQPEKGINLITQDNKKTFESEISDYFEKVENPGMDTVYNCLAAGFSSEELHLDSNFCKTITDAINDASYECRVSAILRLKMFDGIESARTIGDDLLIAILTNPDVSRFDSNDNVHLITSDEAKKLRTLHEKMKANDTPLNPRFLVMFEDNHSLVDSLMADGLDESRVTALNRAIKANIDDINSVEELDNIDQVILSRVENALIEAQAAEDDYGKNTKLVNLMSQLLHGCDYNDLMRSVVEIGLIKRAGFQPDPSDVLDEDYKFSFDKYDKMVASGSLSKEAQAQAVICLSFLNCRKDPKKLGKFLSEYKTLGMMGELSGFIADMQNRLKTETNTNFANEMTTVEKAIDSGCNVSTISYNYENPDDGKKTNSLQVIKFNGQPFTMLTHKLGAYGDFDYGHPEDWNKRKGANYISTSLINNDYIYTVGKKKGRQEAVFYGFGKLGDDYIQGMSAVDLYTMNVVQEENNDGVFINDKTSSDDTINSSLGAYRLSKWYTHTNELCKDTVRIGKYCTTHDTYNEVVLRRYKKDATGTGKEDRVQPSCVMVFGKDEGTITEDAKRHAAYFGVPIYLIDESKY